MESEILNRGDCVSLKQLAVNGSDLIAAGMKPGPEIEATLSSLLEIVLADPALNSREVLLERAMTGNHSILRTP